MGETLNVAKHTPGPWDYINHSWQNSSVVTKETDQLICTLSLCEEDVTEDNQEDLEAQQEADAQLIAAAPDLLDVCTRINDASWEHLKGSYYYISTDTMKMLRDALKKAGQE